MLERQRGISVTSTVAHGSILEPDRYHQSKNSLVTTNMPVFTYCVGWVRCRRCRANYREEPSTARATNCREKDERVDERARRIKMSIPMGLGGFEIETKPRVKYV